ncbi:hypothetical protein [Stappia sp.]|uniref:hypothetical protein n=1 Tax=Stappia sp. TaxID=1870903 RepID=UPI003D0F58AC
MSGHARHADAMSHARGDDHLLADEIMAQAEPGNTAKHAAGTDTPRHDHGDTTQAECCLSFCFPVLASEIAPAPLRARVKPDSDRSVRTLVAALSHGPERPPRA